MSKIKIGNGSSFKEVSNNNFVNETEQVVMQDAKEVEEYQDKRIQRVLPEKSTTYSKSFALNDGTIKSVFGSNPINYFDEKEKVWKEIDSTLKEEGGNYVSNLGKYKAKIKKGGEVAGVMVGDENTYVEWQFLGTKIENNRYCLKDKKSKPNVKVENIKKEKDIFNYGKLKYLSCDEGVDIEYITQGNGVKENIIVNKKSEEYKYYFSLRTKNLSIKLDETESNILFYCVKEGVEEVEFAIPAPYMYDGKNEHSNEVSYELDKVKEGEYIFIVEADANWINSEERVLPITIDPQLILQTDNESSFFKIESTYSISGGTSYVFDEKNYFAGGKNGTYEYVTRLSFPYKQDVNLNNKMVQANLKLRVYSIPASGPILINGKSYTFSQSEEDVYIDVKDLLLGVDGEETIEFVFEKSDTNGLVFFRKTGEYSPKLEIIYELEGNIPKAEKTIDIIGGEGVIDLATGSLVASFDELSVSGAPFSIDIKHVFKKSDKNYFVGDNFRLNINERLLNVADNDDGLGYVYEDEMGIKHGFNKKYTYVNSYGSLQVIDKNLLSIDLDGEIYYEDEEGNRYKVREEQWSSCGLKVYGEKTGLNNIEFFEQRSDSLKELQEKKLSYEESLKDFYVVSTYDASMVMSFEDLSKNTYNNIVELMTKQIAKGSDATRLLLNKGDFLQYKSLLLQYNSLNNELTASGILENSSEMIKSAFLSSKYSIENTNKSIKSKLEPILQSEETSNDAKTVVSSVLSQLTYDGYVVESLISNLKTQLNLAENDWLLLEDYIRQRNLLKRELEEQEAYLEEQVESVRSQIDLIIDNQLVLLEQFKEYYKQYLNVLNELDYLYYNEPQKILTDETIFKCFNKYGNLVAITDKNENEIIFEYKQQRVDAIYVNETLKVKFEYENGLLQSIMDSEGKKIVYSYSSGRLSQIKYPNLKTLSISYNSLGDIISLTSSDFVRETFTYNTDTASEYYGCLTNYQLAAKSVGTSHNNSGLTQSYYASYTAIIESLALEYYSWKAIITNLNGNKEYYLFDDYGVMDSYFEETNGLVTKADRYTITSVYEEKIEHAELSKLNKVAYSEFFDFGNTNYEKITFNEFFKPTILEEYKRISNNHYFKYTTNYTYNNDNKCTRENKNVYHYFQSYYKGFSLVTDYYYATNGKIQKTEKTYGGDKYTKGVDVTEYIYDDKGNLTKTINYNSLDPTSKYYEESEFDEKGNVTATYDATAENKLYGEVGYGSNGTRTTYLPNGSRISYGSDTEENCFSITHSDIDGEENTNKKYFTCGLETRLTSGTSDIKYTYDEKRRLSSISFNGQDSYITYSYAENLSDVISGCLVDSVSTTFGSETETVYTDKAGRTRRIVRNGVHILEYTYDNVWGGISPTGLYDTVTDVVNNKQTKTCYDAYKERVMQVSEIDLTTSQEKILISNGYHTTYDYKNSYNEYIDGVLANNYTFGNTYGANCFNRLSYTMVGDSKFVPLYDSLERNAGKEIYHANVKIAEENISYKKVGDHATKQPSTIRYGENVNGRYVLKDSLKYAYDKSGNISKVYENGELCISYEYDSLDRLVRENNKNFGKTYTFSYDKNGNILTRREYSYSIKDTIELIDALVVKQYTYECGSDKLLSITTKTKTNTGYAESINNFEYNAIGNPIIYNGKSVVWQQNTKLVQFDSTTFTYDVYGKRISKNGILYNFNIDGKIIKQSNGLSFIYDDKGVIGLKYNNLTYYYRKNAQGDIIAIIDNVGNVVVKYNYDAWGNCNVIATDSYITLANLNPYRYRSYYYDTETGLYFLKTRYYDPQVGRFISIDNISYVDFDNINGINLYAYCGNNPVMDIDPDGTWSWKKFWKGVGMAATAVGAVVLAVTTFGAGVPLAMTIVASVTLGAGVLTGINGIATMIEAGTDYNFVRDGLFNEVLGLTDSAYNVYAGIVECTATIGSVVLGVYHTTGQFKAAKASQQYLGKGYKKVGNNRWISSDGLRQVRWDTTHHIYNGKPSSHHFNWYEYSYPIVKGARNKPIKEIHIWLKWFSFYK